MNTHFAAHPADRDHAGPPPRAVRDLRAWFTAGAARAAAAELTPIAQRAADLDPDSPELSGPLREQAHRVTSRLAAAGHLPPQLVVGLDDPPVVVIRTLAVAPDRVTPAPCSAVSRPTPTSSTERST